MWNFGGQIRFENLKLAVKQCYQTGNFVGQKLVENSRCDILGDFQTLWPSFLLKIWFMVFNTQNTSLANTIFQRCGPMFKKVLFFTFYFYVTTHHKVLRKWTNLFKSPFSQHDSYSQADFQTKTLHFLFCMHKPWGLKRTIWKAMKGTFHPDVLFNQYLFNLQHFKFRWSCKKALNWWRNEMHFFSFPWPIIIWSIYSFIEKKPIAEKRILHLFILLSIFFMVKGQ